LNLKQKQSLDAYVGLPLIYLHIVMARVMGFVLRRNHKITNPPKEICIIKLLGFGSVVMASDAIYSIKAKYPQATLSIICSKSIEEGIRSLKLFEKVMVVDDTNIFYLLISTFKIVVQQLFVHRLWIADLEVYSKLTGILSLWTMALNRFGFYFNQVAFRYNLYTHKVYFNATINVEDNYSEIVKAMGVTDFVSFTIPGFAPRKVGSNYEFIALNNTCSEFAQERKLTEAQLVAICLWIISNTPYKVALLGAPSDAGNNQSLIANSGLEVDRVVNFAGVYAFNDYYRFLYDKCALMVTIDSAPLHIANKLNIPNLSIWGPTSPQSRINTNGENLYIYQAVTCSPCAHFVDNLPCNGDNFCIKDIAIGDITNSIQHILNNHSLKIG
jgi:ADP-heptose:LPS heptosyltransferase